jgi:hypothetical protein
MLSAVQIYNSPLISFKTESFIVLSLIDWTYLLHAQYRSETVEYRYFSKAGKRKKFIRNPDGSIRYWDLRECMPTYQLRSAYERRPDKSRAGRYVAARP